MRLALALATIVVLAWLTQETNAAGSNFCTVTKTRKESYLHYYSCYYRYHYYHYYWYYYRYRSSWCIGRWLRRYRTVRYTVRNCCSGWSGSACNIPICSPSCGEGGVCIAPDKACYCKNGLGGSSCETAVCSYKQDCWPGMCKGAAICECSSGFEGDNCQIMRDGPVFQQCSAKFVRKTDLAEITTFDQVCGMEDHANYTFYTNDASFTTITLNWDTSLSQPEDIPIKPRYLNRYVPGVVAVRGQLTLYSHENVEKWSRRVQCVHPVHKTNPHLNVDCRDVDVSYNQPIKHNYRLEVELYGTTGGFKEIHNEHDAKIFNLSYTGTETSQLLHVYFDIEPPYHCSKDDTCGEEEFFEPVFVNPDVSKTAVTIIWSNWNDTDTGLSGVEYKVYKMALNQNHKLEETDKIIMKGQWDQEDVVEPPIFTPEEAGMYSIILEVGDGAGNMAKARALLLYDPISNVTVDDAHPLFVTNAAKMTDYKWITNTDQPLMISWAQHFANKYQDKNNLLAEVEKFETEYDDTNGNRTTDEIPHMHGIINFKMASTINSNELDKVPSTWTNKSLSESDTLAMTRTDGDLIRIWVKAVDIMGNEMVDYTTIEVDSSPPFYDNHSGSVQKNVETKWPRPAFATGISLAVVDQHSGISEIKFQVHEKIAINQTRFIHKGTEKIHVTDKTPTECTVSGKCYCTKSGKCYDRTQNVYLDNCWFMEQDKNAEFVLKFDAFNSAKLMHSDNFHIGKLDGIKGRGEFPPIPSDKLIVKEKSLGSTFVTLQWQHPKACYKIISSVVFYENDYVQKELSQPGKSINLTDLTPSTKYLVSVSLVYENNKKSSSVEIIFTTMENTGIYGGVSDQSGETSIGIIIGGAVGGLIVILLLVLIILLLIRRRQQRPMIPQQITRARQNMMNRISTWYASDKSKDIDDGDDFGDVEASGVDNFGMPSPPPYQEKGESHNMQATGAAKLGQIAYANGIYGEEEEIYSFGEMETDEEAKWKFSTDRINIGQPVPKAKGRFADLRVTTIRNSKGGVETIVAKMLKTSASEDDRFLMKAKMNFFGTALTFHPNIVSFIGALPDNLILLFEYCEVGRLSDWLSDLTTVGGDEEVQFSDFSKMIASGLGYLHSNNIIHRRLGVRNILLKDHYGVLQAKLTGFGPMVGESNTGKSAAKEKAPIKYLAAEQMIIEKNKRRIYTTQSDVWTFGVTIWEIYSKGAVPYAKMRTADVQRKVMDGYRLSKPEYSSDFIYEDVLQNCWLAEPGRRPTMTELEKSLNNYFDGTSSGDLYYDDTQLSEMHKSFDNLYM